MSGTSAGGLRTSTTPGERGALPDRDEEGDGLRAEGLADLAEDAEEVDVVGVHLGQGDDPAEPQPARLLGDLAGVDLDARGGRDGDDHVLDGGQGAQGVADEVGVARRVDEVDLLALPLEVEQVAVDGQVPSFLLVVDVGDAGAVVDRASPVGGAGGEEQGVGKARLARRPMTGQGNVPDVGRCDKSWPWRIVPPGFGLRLPPRADATEAPGMGAGRRWPA